MFEIGRGCQIHETATINVQVGKLGNRSIVGPHAVIEGNQVFIGEEAFIDAYAWIGGGSCHDRPATLTVGDWLHMGRNAHINFARPVIIGHEFGCGMGTKVFSHGAYLPAWEGFPVQWEGVRIGDRVWMPNAWVNPGVEIGSDVVIAARSLVNKDIPSGCLAGGIPAKVLKHQVYPRELSRRERYALLHSIIYQVEQIVPDPCRLEFDDETSIIMVDYDTIFNLSTRTIEGKVTPITEIVKNQLRRNGIRFRYTAKEGEYVPWHEY